MRGKATASGVQSAIRSMLQSNAPAAAVLRDHGATACTDVTGFGVVGHLAEMLRATAPLPPPPPPSRPTEALPPPSMNGGGPEAAPAKEASAAAPASVPGPEPVRLGADLKLDLLPVLPSAVAVVDAGVVSTLQGQNERDNSASVVGGVGAGDKLGARFRLLFDPQTAGGLLASVPQGQAHACVAALKQAGAESAAVIGILTVRANDEAF
ncbi:unnamed protein product [Laminaria digitata]